MNQRNQSAYKYEFELYARHCFEVIERILAGLIVGCDILNLKDLSESLWNIRAYARGCNTKYQEEALRQRM